MIEQLKATYDVTMMCLHLGVSRSEFYRHRTSKPSKTKQANQRLEPKIKALFEAEKSRAGAPRIAEALREQGESVGRNRVAKIMQKMGLRAKAAKKYKATTNSNHQLPVAPNLLEQNFEAAKPDEKYVSDITYIWTTEGWLYLAVVMDLYSRMIVGWAMSERMMAKLVCDAMTMALWKRKLPQQVIVHSDRGSQYCSNEYQKLLSENKLICSMSKKGDCYDNAAMESWNHSFKVEAIHGEQFATRKAAKDAIFDYIEVYYNRQRRHSKLGYLSPAAFEVKQVA